MRVFLSYARASEAVAASVNMALRTEGHDVFFDRASLPTGEGFHRQIRENLESADVLVFLVSPAAVAPGSYALTELKFAEQKWPNPSGRMLAVIVEPTPFTSLPSYLQATTVLQPVGNVAAEVAASLAAMANLAVGKSGIAVRAHTAVFLGAVNRPALFINVTNVSATRAAEVTHVWLESNPRTHVMRRERPLPVWLRPAESWETWIFLSDIPSLHANDLHTLARVRLSNGEVTCSVENSDVPEAGYVPGGSQSSRGPGA